MSLGLVNLLKAMGLDPQVIMSHVTAFSQIAERVQKIARDMETRLENIEVMQAEILKRLDDQAGAREVLALMPPSSFSCEECGKIHAEGKCDHGKRDAA